MTRAKNGESHSTLENTVPRNKKEEMLLVDLNAKVDKNIIVKSNLIQKTELTMRQDKYNIFSWHKTLHQNKLDYQYLTMKKTRLHSHVMDGLRMSVSDTDE